MSCPAPHILNRNGHHRFLLLLYLMIHLFFLFELKLYMQFNYLSNHDICNWQNDSSYVITIGATIIDCKRKVTVCQNIFRHTQIVFFLSFKKKKNLF